MRQGTDGRPTLSVNRPPFDAAASDWEQANVARAAPRPPRKYYDLTRTGQEALADAVKRYRLLEQRPPAKAKHPKPSRA